MKLLETGKNQLQAIKYISKEILWLQKEPGNRKKFRARESTDF
jgi:hypothetical protein